MGLKKKLSDLFKRQRTRREFFAEQVRLFAAGAFFSWPMSSLARIRIRSEEPADPPKAPLIKPRAVQRGPDSPVHPMAKPFVGENLVYDVTFLWLVNAAEGRATFKKNFGDSYIATIEAKATGFIGWLTSYTEQRFLSRMKIKKVGGVDRFVTVYHSRKTHKGKDEIRSIHRFNHQKDKWYYKRYKNGKRIKSRTRKLKSRILDDFVAVHYNFRAGAYGPIEPGRSYTVTTIPFKDLDKFTFRVATAAEMAKEKKWLADHPEGTIMVIVKIDQKVWGVKAGEAKLLGDENRVPIAAYVKDAVTFGNIYADIRRPGAGKSKPDAKPPEPKQPDSKPPEPKPKDTGKEAGDEA